MHVQINGEAIYDSIPWKFQNDTEDMMICYTSSKVSYLQCTRG